MAAAVSADGDGHGLGFSHSIVDPASSLQTIQANGSGPAELAAPLQLMLDPVRSLEHVEVAGNLPLDFRSLEEAQVGLGSVGARNAGALGMRAAVSPFREGAGGVHE